MFVAVGELDVGVRERVTEYSATGVWSGPARRRGDLRRLGKLFEANDGHVDRCAWPFVVGHHLATDPTKSIACLRLGPSHSIWQLSHDGKAVTHSSNSLSSKILCGSLSTNTSKLLSINVRAVVGVNAERCSKGFFSHRSQMGCLGWVSADVPAADSGWVGARSDIARWCEGLYEV